MTKKINLSRATLILVGMLLVLVFALSAMANKAHAALALDPTTTSMLATTLSATGNLMSTVQYDINVGMFNPNQSAALSANLGGIGNVLAAISAMINGVNFPNAGYPPQSN